MSHYLARIEDEAEADKIYRACGKLAINWGPVELLMEAMIIRLRARQKHPSVNGVYADFPVSLSKKIIEIKKRLNGDLPLKQAQLEARAFLTEAKSLHNDRVTVVHGLCQGTLPSGQIMFTVSDQKRGVSATAKYLTLDRIEEVAERLLTLHTDNQHLPALVPLR